MIGEEDDYRFPVKKKKIIGGLSYEVEGEKIHKRVCFMGIDEKTGWKRDNVWILWFNGVFVGKWKGGR